MTKRRELSRAIGLGALALFLIRLMLCFVLGDKVSLFAQPELAAFLIQSETGRQPQDTAPPATTAPTAPQPTEPSAPSGETEPSQPDVPTWDPEIPVEKPSFTAEDMELMGVTYNCVRQPDIQALLTQPLQWDLTGSEPTVLIIHTHGTEAYTPTADTQYTEHGGEFRTRDDSLNMISIGDELTRLLEEAGISVIHDRTAYDDNDYLDAYANAREAVKKWLADHPSIQMVLDLHRDAAENRDGSQWASSCTINGQKSAQIMMVAGSNAMGDYHPDWEQNLALAEKLTVMFNRISKGCGRDLNFRAKRFNQDLSTGFLIAEIGSAGNTHDEAMRAVPVLAEAILALAHGSE